MIPTMIPITGIQKLFSGEANKDFSPLTSQWEDFVLDTLQHKAVLKVLIIFKIIIFMLIITMMMITMIMIRSQSEALRLLQ